MLFSSPRGSSTHTESAHSPWPAAKRECNHIRHALLSIPNLRQESLSEAMGVRSVAELPAPDIHYKRKPAH
eukprot:3921298-Alexandrium_andersonii.AAC.1